MEWKVGHEHVMYVDATYRHEPALASGIPQIQSHMLMLESPLFDG